MPVALTPGTLTESVISRAYAPRWISQVYATDLNQDGNSDLVIVGASYPSDGAPVPQPGVVAFGDGAGGFVLATEAQFPVTSLRTVHPRELVFADFNGDARPDIFVASHGYDAPPFPGEQNRLYLSNADGSWRDATDSLPQVSDFSHGASAGDVNGDGHTDLIVGNLPRPNPVDPYVLVNDGAGHFSLGDGLLPTGTGQVLHADRTRLTAELLFDLDGDGRADLVAGSFDSTASQPRPPFVLWSQQGAYSEGQISMLPLPRHFGADNSVYDIQAIDINQDGRKDLLLAYQQSVALGGWEIQVLINEGDHRFTDQTPRFIPQESAQFGGMPKAASAESQYWVQFIHPIDLNSDGRTDFVLDARGITTAPANFPVAYVQQADGSFQTARVSELAAQQAWLFDYSTQPVTWTGQTGFVKLGLENGVLTAYTLPVSFAPVLPIRTDFSEPVTRWGTRAADALQGGAGNDTLFGNAGDDMLDGAAGIDVARYSHERTQYSLAKTSAGFSISHRDEGKDTLAGVERLQFTDASLALDLEGHAGTVAKILGAVFGKTFILNAQYVGIGLDLLDRGMDYAALAALAVNAAALSTPDQMVSALWKNVMGTTATPADKAPFIDLLEHGMGAGELARLAADSAYNTTNIDLVGLADTGIPYLPVV